MRSAQRRFVKMEMDHLESRNGALLYIAPRSNKLAIVGDREIHAKCGDAFWLETVNGCSGFFHKQQYTEGVLFAIQRVGDALKKHFPKQ
jgi:uncharacterized membrane protein